MLQFVLASNQEVLEIESHVVRALLGELEMFCRPSHSWLLFNFVEAYPTFRLSSCYLFGELCVEIRPSFPIVTITEILIHRFLDLLNRKDFKQLMVVQYRNALMILLD